MKPTQFFTLFLFVASAISACNLPNSVPTPNSEPTVAAISTPLPVVTFPVPMATNIPTGIPSNTATPAPTTGSSSGSSSCTNSADFVTDISVPDGTALDSSVSFVKTWRIKNTGTCTWDSRYSLVFVDGTLLMPVDYAPLPGTVAPGQTIDLSLNMTSPIYPGNYESDWKLRTPSGTLFGVGRQNSPLWIKIVIGSPDTTIMGYVYQDRNGNDVYDNNDILMANREIWLLQNGCGQVGIHLSTSVSGSDGRYVLSGAFTGTYCIVLRNGEAQDDNATVSVAAGQTMNNINLRAAPSTAMISGWVWNDSLQPDGTPQSSESYISGVVVSVQRGECGSPLSVTVSAVTDSSGYYSFRDLYGGPHCVSIRTYEGNNASIFSNGTWVYPVSGIQQVTVRPGEEGIANFGWQYK
jgi:hypothetical protein